MRAVEERVRLKCPDYEVMLKKLTAASREGEDLTEEDLPQEVMELLHEWFDAPEGDREAETEAGPTELSGDDSELDIETLEAELAEWEKTATTLRGVLEQPNNTKGKQKQKKLRAQIRKAESKLAEVAEVLKRRTLRGRAELLLDNPKALEGLRRKWIDAETAKKLDYPLFMATSERGGKDSSGDYIYRKDPAGNILEDDHSSPLIDQDCVKYRDDDPDGIAEHFVKWAKKRKLSFWLGD